MGTRLKEAVAASPYKRCERAKLGHAVLVGPSFVSYVTKGHSRKIYKGGTLSSTSSELEHLRHETALVRSIASKGISKLINDITETDHD
jgi:hypothetical protein